MLHGYLYSRENTMLTSYKRSYTSLVYICKLYRALKSHAKKREDVYMYKANFKKYICGTWSEVVLPYNHSANIVITVFNATQNRDKCALLCLNICVQAVMLCGQA